MSEFKAELVAGDGTRIALEGEQRVGRSEDCDITIDDPKVSRAHAVLRVKGESLSVEDLGSANGTQVNQRATSGETTLRDGDTLSFDKHRYVVALSGGAEADMDATVVGGGDAGDDATVVSASGPEPEPAAAEPPPSPAPEPPETPKPPPGPSDLPGSWIDSGTSESTRVLGLDAMAESESERVHMERASDLPHLIVVAQSGEAGDALELEPGTAAGGEPDVWEIGRDPSCEIALDEPSVSARHAQLIHQGGRWKLVNLVSANGIFVNGEKRLTAYLADGDEIRLGVATLVFRSGVNDPAPGPAASPASPGAGGDGKGRGPLMAAAAALVVVALGAAAYFFLG